MNEDTDLCWEFVCEDCNINVLLVGPNPPDRAVCLTCQWIRNAPEADRRRLREFLNE